jgi:hypothetical protein
MLIYAIVVYMMQVPVMEVVNVAGVADCCMAAIGPVNV